MKLTPTQTFLLMAIICAVLMLTGCTTAPVVTPGRTVVGLKCKAVEPPRPVMPTDLLDSNTVTLDEFAQAAQAELELREGYEEELRVALRSCK